MSDKKTLILASKSPRRREILDSLNIPYTAKESNFDEPDFRTTKMNAEEFVIYNATEKAREVAANESNALVIGMDTIVEYNDTLFGKPKNHNEALETIKFLNGTTHQVITGICIIDADGEVEVSTVESTLVTFSEMSQNEIEDYLICSAWDNYAGGYAIQGLGSLFIEKIEGDYFNVVGFPIYKFGLLMKEMGIPVLDLIKQNGKS